jgi:hypothetical protein
MPARPSDKDRMGVKTLGWWVVGGSQPNAELPVHALHFHGRKINLVNITETLDYPISVA